MTTAQTGTKPTYRRRNYIIDKPLQFSIIFTALGALMLVAFLSALAYFVLPSGEVMDALTGDQVRSLIIKINAGCFAVTFMTVGVIMVFISHRVAGPGMVLERAVSGFLEGDFSRRTKLRKKDYLQNLSTTVTALADQLRGQTKAREQLVRDVEGCLTEGDVEGARKLLAEWTATWPAPAAEERANATPSQEPVSA